ncbi:MAG TPA: hypothetical protein VD884_03975 [Ohtaekwangia sp.]|nr:hypothetical protein [Ohtaekwangia sp.]
MIDFEKIKRLCEDNNVTSRRYVDDFMLHYAAGRDNLKKEMRLDFRRFRHILQQLPEPTVNQMMSQYITHRVFRSNGTIRKLINHVEVKAKGAEALAFYQHQLENPWRFCFTEMIDMPAPDFHLHRDVFSGEEYLIYSRGMSQTFADYNESVCLWFNLLAFNGHCWQTYGPIAAYKSIEPDDVFYFAGEVDDRVSDDDDVIGLVQKNPLPFMMLISGGNVPVIVNKNDQLLVHTATIDVPTLDPASLAPEFVIEHAHGITKLSLPEWSLPMHYAAAYFDNTDDELFCYSMTERGFNAIVTALAKKGITVGAPDIRINMSSVITMEHILSREIRVNPYGKLFEEPMPEEKDEQMEKLNIAMQLAMQDFNARKSPDYEAYAAASGLTVDEIKPFVQKALARVEQMLKKS